MKKENQAALIISQEIFTQQINAAEEIFKNKSILKNDLKYQNEAINKSLKSTFDFASEVLQKVIDENLKSYFEVPQFLKMNLENFEETFNHNLQILSASRRLLKFIN
jgi:hypothetical protein